MPESAIPTRRENEEENKRYYKSCAGLLGSIPSKTQPDYPEESERVVVKCLFVYAQQEITTKTKSGQPNCANNSPRPKGGVQHCRRRRFPADFVNIATRQIQLSEVCHKQQTHTHSTTH